MHEAEQLPLWPNLETSNGSESSAKNIISASTRPKKESLEVVLKRVEEWQRGERDRQYVGAQRVSSYGL